MTREKIDLYEGTPLKRAALLLESVNALYSDMKTMFNTPADMATVLGLLLAAHHQAHAKDPDGPRARDEFLDAMGLSYDAVKAINADGPALKFH